MSLVIVTEIVLIELERELSKVVSDRQQTVNKYRERETRSYPSNGTSWRERLWDGAVGVGAVEDGAAGVGAEGAARRAVNGGGKVTGAGSGLRAAYRPRPRITLPTTALGLPCVCSTYC